MADTPTPDDRESALQTQCGFCVDGAFVLRARAGQEQRTIRCPYCDGHGNIIQGLVPNDGSVRDG